MGWSLWIGRIRGIDVYVHFTFFLLLGFVFLAHLARDSSAAAAVEETLFIVLIFGIVVLHELGHALAAARYGIATRDITLLPIGGVARLERMPEDPGQELVVALAGPAVNVVLAAAIFAYLAAAGALGGVVLTDRPIVDGDLLPRLFWVNVILVVFNMLPAFPMDGGRVLRAVLAMNMSYVQATQIAANVGQVFAVLFGFLGLVGNPLLLFVAFFVWIGAAQEASLVQMRAALGGIPVAQVMARDFHTVAPDDTVRAAADRVLGGFQHDFPVVADGRVVGVLTRLDLLAALAQRGGDVRVGDVMRTDFQAIDPAEMLDRALPRLQGCDCRAMPVVRDGVLVGMVALDAVAELLLVRSGQGRPA